MNVVFKFILMAVVMISTINNDIDRHFEWIEYHHKFKKKLEFDLSKLGLVNNTFPSLLWCPNRAQERFFNAWMEPPYPWINLITFGNGTGKTFALGEFLCGVIKGKNWVNPIFCQCDYFDEFDEKRRSGDLTIWWVCDADLMKEKSPDYKAIKWHIPDAKFKSKDSKGVYHEIHVPVEGEDELPVNIVVQVKTHGQATTSFSGENVDLIICDEPPPEQHWNEMAGRTRSKVGEVGARIVIGGTPLKISGYLYDLIEDPEFTKQIVHLEGSLWENCDGLEIPDDEAKKRNIPKSTDYESFVKSLQVSKKNQKKRIELFEKRGGIYLTRGVLSFESIDRQITLWRKSHDPMELPSRVDGKFTHVQGRIYKTFSRRVHVIKSYPVPEEYPKIMIMDPHDARPDTAGWWAITPRDKMICIAEYPRMPYEAIYSRPETIPETCDTWRLIESRIPGEVIEYFGDPNKLLDPDPYTGKTLWQLYQYNGFTFNTNLTDKLEYGHEMVRQFLHYDEERMQLYPDNPQYQPIMLFFDVCENHINYMIRYATIIPKDLSKPFGEKIDEKYKDFPDLVRYKAVIYKPYSYWKNYTLRKNNEWERIKKARDPYGTVDSYKGRRIIESRAII